MAEHGEKLATQTELVMRQVRVSLGAFGQFRIVNKDLDGSDRRSAG